MTQRKKPPLTTVRRIILKEQTVARLDPATVAAALGAEPTGARIEGRPGPITLYALRSALLQSRQPTGGRPGIDGATIRPKIPLTPEAWEQLEALAAELSAEGFSPSAGQVASVLLSLALKAVSDTKDAAKPSPAESDPLTKELARRMKRRK
jgi:hypothetical protein